MGFLWPDFGRKHEECKMQTEKTDIKSLYYEELAAKIGEMGEKKFRATQIFEWLHKHQVKEFSQMVNLPVVLRERLCENFSLVSLRSISRSSSRLSFFNSLSVILLIKSDK